MQYIFLSFFAGILTVISPCVFTLLPIILGTSLENRNLKRAFRVISSLVISIFLFTILLKVSSAFINVPQAFWTIVSGGILVIFGVFTLFPDLWTRILLKTGIQNKTDSFLNKASKKGGVFGDILVGAALGPVFSSCSPTYAIILATVLPVDFKAGIIDLFVYVLGLGLFLLLISFFGQKLVQRFKWTTNPNGILKKIIGVIFIIIGLLIMTGLDIQLETFLLNNGFFDVTGIESRTIQNNLEQNNPQPVSSPTDSLFNVAKPYPAPEFTQIADWINSSPLTMKDLKGKVVLIDFWTYSCINCLRTLPFVKDWYSKYKDDGLVVIGVHTPEFSFEKVKQNVVDFINKNGITYPVAQDNSYGTWTAYNNLYWPAEYFIDKSGNIVNTKFGEGDYDKDENVIRTLLGLNQDPNAKNAQVPVSGEQSPETYLGYDKGSNFENQDQFLADLTVNYTLKSDISESSWSLGGKWDIKNESSVSEDNNVVLRYNFSAKEVYLVVGSDTAGSFTVKLNGKLVDSSNKGDDVDNNGKVTLNGPRLYNVIKLNQFQSDQILELTFTRNVSVDSFTFGS